MRLPPQWSRSLLVPFFSHLIFWATPVAGQLTAATIFNIPTGSNGGNCGSQDINTVVTEARDMAQAAINKINGLQTNLGQPIRGLPDVLISAKTAAAMFKISYDIPKGILRIPPASLAILNTVKGYYQNVVNFLETDRIIGYLACDDTGFRWVTHYSDVEPILAGSEFDAPIASLFVAPDVVPTIPGYYYSNEWTMYMPELGTNQANGNYGGGLCSNFNVNAMTCASYRAIIMCPSAWLFQLNDLVATRANQASVAVGTSIENFVSTPGTFLHEMMHFINQGIDDQEVIFTDADGQVVRQPAYGFWACAALRFPPNNPSLMLKNADNYLYFALTSYLDGNDWSSGMKQ